MIELLKYIILGLVQGIAEPLPISSSGHLIIAQYFFDIDLPGLTFEMFTNFGSLIAIVIFFRRKLLEIIKDFFFFLKTREEKYKPNFWYVIFIAIATIPVVICGLLFNSILEKYLANIYIVASALLVTALILFIINRLSFKKEKKDSEITVVDSLLIGMSQVLALIPGISRSGATISAARTRKISTTSAMKFSFLLYIPVSLGAGILGIKDLLTEDSLSNHIPYYLVSFVVAGIATFFAIKFFANVLNNKKLHYFSIYCVSVAILVIIVAIIK